MVERLMLNELVIRRHVELEEVSEIDAFLCGPAASFVTGSAITVDGGSTAR